MDTVDLKFYVQHQTHLTEKYILKKYLCNLKHTLDCIVVVFFFWLLSSSFSALLIIIHSKCDSKLCQTLYPQDDLFLF